MAKIIVDNDTYDTDSLSEEAIAQIQSIQFVDSELAQLNACVAAMNTARNAYVAALQELLPTEQDAEVGTTS